MDNIKKPRLQKKFKLYLEQQDSYYGPVLTDYYW